MFKKYLLLSVILIVLSIPLVVFAQNGDLPPALQKFLSEYVVGLVLPVIATTKLIRSVLGSVKGTAAFILTIVIGLMVGWVQHGLMGTEGHFIGLGIGLLGGLVAAGAFTAAKLFGKKTQLLDVK